MQMRSSRPSTTPASCRCTDGGKHHAGVSLPTEAAAAEGSVSHGAYSLLANGPASAPDPGYGAVYLDVNTPGQTSGNTTIPSGSNPPGFSAVSSTDGDSDQ